MNHFLFLYNILKLVFNHKQHCHNLKFFETENIVNIVFNIQGAIFGNPALPSSIGFEQFIRNVYICCSCCFPLSEERTPNFELLLWLTLLLKISLTDIYYKGSFIKHTLLDLLFLNQTGVKFIIN